MPEVVRFIYKVVYCQMYTFKEWTGSQPSCFLVLMLLILLTLTSALKTKKLFFYDATCDTVYIFIKIIYEFYVIYLYSILSIVNLIYVLNEPSSLVNQILPFFLYLSGRVNNNALSLL